MYENGWDFPGPRDHYDRLMVVRDDYRKLLAAAGVNSGAWERTYVDNRLVEMLSEATGYSMEGLLLALRAEAREKRLELLRGSIFEEE